MDFGERIKRLREGKKLSQDDLAQLMGKKHRNVIGSWEKGKAEPSLSDVRKLAEILSTNTVYLIEGIDINQIVTPAAPSGYVMMKAEEVIEMQRQLLESKDRKIEEKNKELSKKTA
ncbi:helix-turn-helix domain-containing protein [Larkinella punicea]|uniref:XRE family transcriptional regulator n=1 Tax=Larkinella punicea TaxID=2315727 RepID=A0A368JRX8_9BACT|nr:helix-turn-helix transcriptional regulator [Larkinella punicea]RCR69444.1 XRE family transcriptional regulator [Larkinella punicea]